MTLHLQDRRTLEFMRSYEDTQGRAAGPSHVATFNGWHPSTAVAFIHRMRRSNYVDELGWVIR